MFLSTLFRKGILMKKGMSALAILFVCVMVSVSFGWQIQGNGYYGFGLGNGVFGSGYSVQGTGAYNNQTTPWTSQTQAGLAGQGAAVYGSGSAMQGLLGGAYQNQNFAPGSSSQTQIQGALMGQGLTSGPGSTSVGGQGSLQGQTQSTPYGSQTSVIGAFQFGSASGGASVYSGLGISTSQSQVITP
jgi:hypothetical protein